MKITFYDNESDKHYSLSFKHVTPTKIWLNDEEYRGMEVNTDELMQVIYDAIDKYFKEKY